VSVCVRALQENAKLSTRVLNGSTLACVDAEVKRSLGQGHRVIKCVVGAGVCMSI